MMREILQLILLLIFLSPLQALTEKEFFDAVKNKEKAFKSGVIEFEYHYIKWSKKEYLKFVYGIKKCLDKPYPEVKKCFLKKAGRKLKKREFVPIEKIDSKITYIFQYDKSKTLLPDKIYVKRIYLYDSVRNYLKNKSNTEKENICRMKEYLFIKNKEYIEKCVFLNPDKPKKIIKQPADDKNLRRILIASEIGWLSNIDRSFGIERIKAVSKKYKFKIKDNRITIKTENGILVFNADKSFSSRKVISYYKGTKKKSEEVLYGVYTLVNGIYVPFFVSSSHFDRKNNSVETDFYLVESFKLTEPDDDNFRIIASSFNAEKSDK